MPLAYSLRSYLLLVGSKIAGDQGESELTDNTARTASGKNNCTEMGSNTIARFYSLFWVCFNPLFVVVVVFVSGKVFIPSSLPMLLHVTCCYLIV